MINALRGGVTILAMAAFLGGCATSAALRSGQTAETLQDYDRAVVEYTKVLTQNPNNRDARQGLERAKARASQEHLARGRRLEATGRLEQAEAELQTALQLNPTSEEIDDALQAVRVQLRTKIAVTRDGKTQLESLIDGAKNLAPLGLELPRAQLPASLVFPNASSRDVYSTIARFGNISVAFDTQFRDQNVSLDLRNQSIEEGLRTVSAATRNFFRVTAPRTVTIIPDTPAKRREYEEEVLKTFYVSNVDLKEAADLLRIVLDARRIGTSAATNSITMRDTPERVVAAGQLLQALDKARPEVVIEVELLEFDRTRLREYGLGIASPGSLGLEGSITVEPNSRTASQLQSLTSGNILFGSLPGIYYKLLKTDGSARTLANIQLRTIDGLSARSRFGEEVPIPITTFAQIATGGLPQQPVTSFQYRNVGVNIDITPRTHHDDAVSLALKLQVSSPSGVGFGDLPTFGNREVENVIRLRDGETNMLAGLIRDDERTSGTGIPGLSDLPVIGKLFGRTRKEAQQTDIVMTLTPRIIRVLELDESDLRPFRLGRDGDAVGGGGIIELPLQPQLPPRDPVGNNQDRPDGGPAPTLPPPVPPTQGPIFAPTGK